MFTVQLTVYTFPAFYQKRHGPFSESTKHITISFSVLINVSCVFKFFSKLKNLIRLWFSQFRFNQIKLSCSKIISTSSICCSSLIRPENLFSIIHCLMSMIFSRIFSFSYNFLSKTELLRCPSSSISFYEKVSLDFLLTRAPMLKRVSR